MIEGCLDWQANGLVRPESVKAATEDYFAEQDLIGQWLDEECDIEPGNTHKFGLIAASMIHGRTSARRRVRILAPRKC